MATSGRNERRLGVQTSSDAIQHASAIATERGPDNCFRRTVGREVTLLQSALRRYTAIRSQWWFVRRPGESDRRYRRLSSVSRRTQGAIQRYEQWETQTAELWQKLMASRIRAASTLHDMVAASFNAEAHRCERLLAERPSCPSYDQALSVTAASLSSLGKLTTLCDRFEQVSRDLAAVIQRHQAIDRGDLAADQESDRLFSLSVSSTNSAESAVVRGDLVRAEGLVKTAASQIREVEQFLARGRKYANEEAEFWRGVSNIASTVATIADWPLVVAQGNAESVSEWQRVRHQIDAKVNGDAAACRHANGTALGKAVRPLAWNEPKMKPYEEFVCDIVKLTRLENPQ